MYEDLKTCLDPLRFEEKRLVYKYPEHNVEDTKKISKLESREIKNKALEVEETDKDDKRINMALKIFGIVCVVIVIVGLAFILALTLNTAKEVKVPNDLIGLSEKEACKKLEKLKLICKVKYVYDKEYEEDVVIKVSPNNTTIKEKQTVVITVSSFEDTIEVEDYKGKNLDIVKSELENLGIRVVTTPKKVTKDDKIEENTIVSQSVEEGERLQKNNSVIELVYATLIAVYPDFTDGSYTVDLIQQFCDDNDITCSFKDLIDNNYNEGDIILQSRAVGDEVKSKTTLTITVAKNTKEEINNNEENGEV